MLGYATKLQEEIQLGLHNSSLRVVNNCNNWLQFTVSMQGLLSRHAKTRFLAGGSKPASHLPAV